MTANDLAQEVAYLRDLFQRKLLEDRGKNELIAAVQESLSQRDALDRGAAYRDVFTEALVALDRLRSEAPSRELSESVIEELLEVFVRRGLTPVPVQGPVDLRLHEIIETVPESEQYRAGEIIYVEREGYMLGERLLRAARVVVAVAENRTEP